MGQNTSKGGDDGLDTKLRIERIYDADREAILAALRIVLGLPTRLLGTEMDRR